MRRAQDVTAAEAAGKALVFLSSTPDDPIINTKFRLTVTPVFNSEPGVMDDMGMTGLGATDFGTMKSQTSVGIVGSSHPLAAGLSGTVVVTNASVTFPWGVPNATRKAPPCPA